MDFLIDLLGFALALFGLFIIGCNYVRQYQNQRNRNGEGYSHSSPAPLVGPLFLIVGLHLIIDDLSGWVFLIFLFDPDTLIVLLGLPFLVRELTSRSADNEKNS